MMNYQRGIMFIHKKVHTDSLVEKCLEKSDDLYKKQINTVENNKYDEIIEEQIPIIENQHV